MMNHSELVRFYQMQLVKFRALQTKNIHKTEFGTRITPILIGATERRLNELRAGKVTQAILDIPIFKNGIDNG